MSFEEVPPVEWDLSRESTTSKSDTDSSEVGSSDNSEHVCASHCKSKGKSMIKCTSAEEHVMTVAPDPSLGQREEAFGERIVDEDQVTELIAPKCLR
jgi:hypothetical protein